MVASEQLDSLRSLDVMRLGEFRLCDFHAYRAATAASFVIIIVKYFYSSRSSCCLPRCRRSRNRSQDVCVRGFERNARDGERTRRTLVDLFVSLENASPLRWVVKVSERRWCRCVRTLLKELWRRVVSVCFVLAQHYKQRCWVWPIQHIKGCRLYS